MKNLLIVLFVICFSSNLIGQKMVSEDEPWTICDTCRKGFDPCQENVYNSIRNIEFSFYLPRELGDHTMSLLINGKSFEVKPLNLTEVSFSNQDDNCTFFEYTGFIQYIIPPYECEDLECEIVNETSNSCSLPITVSLKITNSNNEYIPMHEFLFEYINCVESAFQNEFHKIPWNNKIFNIKVCCSIIDNSLINPRFGNNNLKEYYQLYSLDGKLIANKFSSEKQSSIFESGIYILIKRNNKKEIIETKKLFIN